jgi:hypothetical protein
MAKTLMLIFGVIAGAVPQWMPATIYLLGGAAIIAASLFYLPFMSVKANQVQAAIASAFVCSAAAFVVAQSASATGAAIAFYFALPAFAMLASDAVLQRVYTLRQRVKVSVVGVDILSRLDVHPVQQLPSTGIGQITSTTAGRRQSLMRKPATNARSRRLSTNIRLHENVDDDSSAATGKWKQLTNTFEAALQVFPASALLHVLAARHYGFNMHDQRTQQILLRRSTTGTDVVIWDLDFFAWQQQDLSLRAKDSTSHNELTAEIAVRFLLVESSARSRVLSCSAELGR